MNVLSLLLAIGALSLYGWLVDRRFKRLEGGISQVTIRPATEALMVLKDLGYEFPDGTGNVWKALNFKLTFFHGMDVVFVERFDGAGPSFVSGQYSDFGRRLATVPLGRFLGGSDESGPEFHLKRKLLLNTPLGVPLNVVTGYLTGASLEDGKPKVLFEFPEVLLFGMPLSSKYSEWLKGKENKARLLEKFGLSYESSFYGPAEDDFGELTGFTMHIHKGEYFEFDQT